MSYKYDMTTARWHLQFASNIPHLVNGWNERSICLRTSRPFNLLQLCVYHHFRKQIENQTAGTLVFQYSVYDVDCVQYESKDFTVPIYDFSMNNTKSILTLKAF